MRGLKRMARGATQLGFVDVLTAVILLGILLYASTLQFSVYNRAPLTANPNPTSAAASH
jgi:multisubunit Na+/H+ antiporter MnhB subunit